MSELGGVDQMAGSPRTTWIWRILAVVGLVVVGVAAFLITRSLDKRESVGEPNSTGLRPDPGAEASSDRPQLPDSDGDVDVAESERLDRSEFDSGGPEALDEQAEVARDAAIAFYTFSWEPRPDLRIDEVIMAEARPNTLGQILHTEFYSRDCTQEVARAEVAVEQSDPPFFVVDMDYQVTCPDGLSPEDLPRDYTDGSLLPLEYSDQVGVTVSLGPNDRYWATRLEKLWR